MTPLQPPLIYRPAHADELGRAASLCSPGVARPGDGPQQCFVALREGPLERLLGAAFWRGVTETDGCISVEFEGSVLAAVAACEAGFLEALVEQVAGSCPQAQRIAAAAWLPPEHPRAAKLQEAGFVVAGERQWFSADAAVWREALGTPPLLPVGGTLLRPLPEHYETLKGLLCGAALRPSELAQGLQTAASESPSLFDPRCSAVLNVAGEITAACLAQSSGGHLTLAAMTGAPDTCLHLLGHALHGREGLTEPASVGFFLDERDPPSGSLAGLAARLPVHPCGSLKRHERPLSRHAHGAA
jgi:hypothetical protein